jgi:hypothetical protein
MQASASGHLDGFQIETVAFPLGLKHHVEQRLDFPCDFLMNSRRRLSLSTSVQPVSSGWAGRRRQISSLRAVNSAVRS